MTWPSKSWLPRMSSVRSHDLRKPSRSLASACLRSGYSLQSWPHDDRMTDKPAAFHGAHELHQFARHHVLAVAVGHAPIGQRIAGDGDGLVLRLAARR